MSARIVAIHITLPHEISGVGADGKPQTWRSGMFKKKANGPVWAGKNNLDGDGSADLRYHGGPDRVMLLYATEHLPFWREKISRPDMEPGAFGENLSTEGLSEKTACIGDTFGAGDAIIQVTCPREPCWKLARRWNCPDLVRYVQETGFGGFYLRVLKEGFLEAGQELKLLNRPHPGWTMLRASQIMNSKDAATLPQAAELAALQELGARWKERLAQKLAR